MAPKRCVEEAAAHPEPVAKRTRTKGIAPRMNNADKTAELVSGGMELRSKSDTACGKIPAPAGQVTARSAQSQKASTVKEGKKAAANAPWVDMQGYGTEDDNADIKLQMEGDAKSKAAGYIVAWDINKSPKPQKGKPYWVQELLEAIEAGSGDETGELRAIMGELYHLTKAGTARVSTIVSKEYHRFLSEEGLVFIDTVKLNDKFRSTGIAQMALSSFHQFVEDELQIKTIVLSPARGAGSKWRNLDDAQVEAKLIASYRKSGYTVWMQGDPEFEGSITVMGMRLEGEIND